MIEQSIHDLIASITKRLQESKEETEPQQTAWWILSSITKKTEPELLAQGTITLTKEEFKTLNEWLNLYLKKHMPLQYLIGTVPFAQLTLFVEEPILIPRPETEEWVLTLIKKLSPLKDKKLSILDIGCGTGCIAIALAKALPHATIYATDISKKALVLTEKNARYNDVTNLTIVESNLYEGLPPASTFDLIVSNPPYIALTEWPTLSKSVTKWEDKHALLAGKDGLDIIRIIAQQTPAHLHPNDDLRTNNLPQLVLEIGHTQGKAVIQLLQDAGFTHCSLQKDLEGKDRVIYARL